MSGIDSWRSLREACEQYGATSITVPALVAAVRDEAARDAGAKALEDAADVVPAKVPTPRYFRDWLRDRAAALRAAPPTEADDAAADVATVALEQRVRAEREGNA